MANLHAKVATCRGTAIIEFALVLPFLTALFLGTIMFGYDFHVYHRLEEMVRIGARYASIQRYDAFTKADPAVTETGVVTTPVPFQVTSGAFLARVRNITLYGCEDRVNDTACAALQPVVEQLTPENVTVTLMIRNNVPVAVRVALMNVQLSTPLGNLTLNGKPVTEFTYYGSYAPTDSKK